MATFYSTVGADRFLGSEAIDTVSYENATSRVKVYISNGGSPEGWAVGDYYSSIENVIGSNFGDYISGNGRNNYLYGMGGRDTIYGFAGVGTTTHMFGGDGIDTLVGGAGIDIMDGGEGEDTVSYFLSPKGVTVSLADQKLNLGWAAGDTYKNIQDVIGSEFNDIIYGSKEGILNQLQGQGGDDKIFGGTGYNVLIGGSGADQLTGGASGNLIDYETALAGVTASILDPSKNTGDAKGDTYINLVGKDLAGSPFDDILYADNGNNNIMGDPNAAIYGRVGNDKIYAGGGNDVIHGDGGADRLDGEAGYDVVAYDSSSKGLSINMGNPGASTGDAKGDTFFNIEGILGTKYDDIITGDGKNNILQGQGGNDTIYGGGGKDLLLGNDGNDIIYGTGTSEMKGGAGADIFRFRTAADSIATPKIASAVISDFQHGIDKLDLSAFSPTKITITAGATYYKLEAVSSTGTFAIRTIGQITASDVITKKAGLVIKADAQNLNLTGDTGSDKLTGSTHANRLSGGAGNDTLTGSGGNDVFVFHKALNATTNVDHITDFHNVAGDNDIIHLDNAVFTALKATGALAAGLFAANATGVATQADDRIIYDTDSGKLYYDSNGSAAGGAVHFATLDNHPTITAADFFII